MNSEHYAETIPQRTGVRGTLQGLLVTLKNLLKGFVGDIPTVQYPDGRRNYSERFRGIHVLLSREDGSPRCVACYMCATACPADCIEIEAAEDPDRDVEKYPREFKIDLLRCVFCGLCVEACPKEAIVMTRNYETGFHSREEAIYSRDRLLEKAKLPEQNLGYRPRYSP
ncbi:MAG: NADH-quinone oxidoreductase subunit I [Candidatus Eisenbacteria bacterium]|nr:NADH-quinone oxidoreductase subunit I [Candidatus Eisenbacteria bacterium]